MAFAAWLDGTLIWDDSTLAADARAYRTTHVDPAQVRSLVDRARARFESLPQRVMLPSLAFDSGYHLQVISLEDAGAYFELTWGGAKEPETYAVLAPVWKDVRMMIDAAIPKEGDVITLDQVR